MKKNLAAYLKSASRIQRCRGERDMRAIKSSLDAIDGVLAKAKAMMKR